MRSGSKRWPRSRALQRSHTPWAGGGEGGGRRCKGGEKGAQGGGAGGASTEESAKEAPACFCKIGKWACAACCPGPSPALPPHPAAHLYRRDLVCGQLARREQAGDGGVHNGGLLGRAAGEGMAQPLAQLRCGEGGAPGIMSWALGRVAATQVVQRHQPGQQCTALALRSGSKTTASQRHTAWPAHSAAQHSTAQHTCARWPVWSTEHSSRVPLSAITRRCTSNRGASVRQAAGAGAPGGVQQQGSSNRATARCVLRNGGGSA